MVVLDIVAVCIFYVNIRVKIFNFHLMYIEDYIMIDFFQCQNIVDGLISKLNLAIIFQVIFPGDIDTIPSLFFNFVYLLVVHIL